MSIVKRVLLATLLASFGLGICAPAVSAAEPEPAKADSPAFPEREVRVWQMGLLRADRIQHTMLSFSTGLMIGLTSEEPLAAASGSMVLGVAKELWDARTGRFDMIDLLADALGAAGAYATTATLTR